jgi:hypothetical protein
MIFSFKTSVYVSAHGVGGPPAQEAQSVYPGKNSAFSLVTETLDEKAKFPSILLALTASSNGPGDQRASMFGYFASLSYPRSAGGTMLGRAK